MWRGAIVRPEVAAGPSGRAAVVTGRLERKSQREALGPAGGEVDGGGVGGEEAQVGGSGLAPAQVSDVA